MATSTARQLPRVQFYSIVGLVFLIITIPFMIAGLRYALDLQSGADPSKEPQEVVVSNITESNATISWFTTAQTEGAVKYGTAADSLNFVATDIRTTGAFKQHIVQIKNLSPNTKYFYEITADGTADDDKGKGSFTTFSALDNVGVPKTIKGTVSPAGSHVLVYAFASNGTNDSEVRSSYTASNGTFTYDIANLRTEDGSTLFPLENAKLVTYVHSADTGKARKVHATNADPGTMTLDAASTLTFTKDVDVSTAPPPPPPAPSPTPTPTPNPPPPAPAKDPGISIMNTVYNDSRANADPTRPTSIFVSNVSDTSFQVNWITKEPTKGHVVHGRTSTVLSRKALDVRDSTDTVERYTHSVLVNDSSITANKSIYFKISANGALYGSNNGNSSYEFVTPAILSSPPTPAAQTGTLDFLSGSKLSTSKRDFIIYSKVDDNDTATTGQSVYVSTVPAFGSSGWSLSVGGARSADLTKYVDPKKVDITVVGEYNSSATKAQDVSTTSAEIDIVPGLSIDVVRHEDVYPSLSTFSGTAAPNSSVTIQIGNNSYSETADSVGEWEIASIQLAQGDYTMNMNGGSQVLGLEFTIDLDALPNTSINPDVLFYFAGLMLILGGFLVTRIRRKDIISPLQQ